MSQCSTRSSSPTGARSPSGSSAPCGRLGIRTVAVYTDPDRDARHVAEADEAVGDRPGPAPTSTWTRIVDAAATQPERTRSIPGTASSSENPQLARRCGPPGWCSSARRPTPSRSWATRSTPSGRSRRPRVSRSCRAATKPASTDAQLAEAAHEIGLAGPAQAVRRRRRQGHAPGRRPGRPAARPSRPPAARRPARSGTPPCSSSACGPAPPHRGPGVRRHPRQVVSPRRARMQPPAPTPEDRRGGPFAAPRRGHPGRMGASAVAAARACGYVGRGNGRVHHVGRPARPLLLHGDEHPAPGRAPRHRGGPRSRPGRVAAAGGRRRTASLGWLAATPEPTGPRRRGPGVRRGPGPRVPAGVGTGAGPRRTRPAGPMSGSTPACRRAPRSAPTTTRCWPRSSPGETTAPKPCGRLQPGPGRHRSARADDQRRLPAPALAHPDVAAGRLDTELVERIAARSPPRPRARRRPGCGRAPRRDTRAGPAATPGPPWTVGGWPARSATPAGGTSGAGTPTTVVERGTVTIGDGPPGPARILARSGPAVTVELDGSQAPYLAGVRPRHRLDRARRRRLGGHPAARDHRPGRPRRSRRRAHHQPDARDVLAVNVDHRRRRPRRPAAHGRGGDENGARGRHAPSKGPSRRSWSSPDEHVVLDQPLAVVTAATQDSP